MVREGGGEDEWNENEMREGGEGEGGRGGWKGETHNGHL